MRLSLRTLLLWSIVPMILTAQQPFHIGTGLTTFWINGKNPARETLAFLGGGFSGSQVGIGLQWQFPKLIPLPWQYPDALDPFLLFQALFFRGQERYPYPNANLYRQFAVDVFVISPGLQLPFIRFSSITGAFFAAALDIVRISKGQFTQRFIRLDGEIIHRNTYTIATKTAVWRLGATVRLGVWGQFHPDFTMQATVGYSALNLFGRDPNRGELLTPDPTLEIQERIVAGIVTSLLIMYHF